MNVREIIKDVYYVGVNDRVTGKFEALWPLPLGVSYNSYIVKGTDKIALMDTVHIDEVREYLAGVERAVGGRDVDYLVVHHMEPDHSGSIVQVLNRWPELKIIGNAQTIGMIKGFYHVEDTSRFLEIKDGTEIGLGGITLKFCLTPMVHWPETMMTYVPELKTLFSGDGFGTFGALNGAIVDDEMDVEPYWPEMYRYYSNIVGKYGKFVQRALSSLSGLQLDYICSTHGPVWHSQIEKVVGIYDHLSRYESEEGAVIIYASMYGNTAEVAEEIARGLAEGGIKKIKVHNASFSNMSDMISDAFRYKGLIVGSATYSMTVMPPVQAFLTAMSVREVTGKIMAGFGGYTWALGPVRVAIESFASVHGMEQIGYVAMKQSIDDTVRDAAHKLGLEMAAKIKEACK